MATRAWTVWGIGAALAGGLAASAKPPELPGNPRVDGKVPPPLTQDHHQVEVLPPPRLLPPSVLDPNPRHGPERAQGRAADLDIPVRLTSFGPPIRRSTGA